MANIIVAITGASGSVYAQQLLKYFAHSSHRVYLVITGPGKQVVKHELGWDLPEEIISAEVYLSEILGFDNSRLRLFDWQDIGALIASGSAKTDAMVVIPCTMSTIAGIAHGQAANLVERAADIMLKEGRPLIIVPRETPLNVIHLRNMLTLAEMGVKVIPAMPAFYHQPQSIDDLTNFIVGRVLDLLNFEHQLYRRWEG